MSLLFTSGSQRIGASVLASVLPMNIQGWFPLGLTALIRSWLCLSLLIPLARVLTQGTQHIRVHSGPARWRRKLLEFLQLFTQTQNLNAMYKVRINPFYQNLFSLLASLTVGTIILIIWPFRGNFLILAGYIRLNATFGPIFKLPRWCEWVCGSGSTHRLGYFQGLFVPWV